MADGLTEQRVLSLGYSPCPNDTFIFYGLTHGRIAGSPKVQERLEDIETLNHLALTGEVDTVKISFHALGHFLDRYCLLRSGGALGRGCGPLVVAREAVEVGDLANRKVAIPGELTTAALLVRLFCPDLSDLEIMPFDRIMEAVRSGEVDAGVIIHEGRFTYQAYGLSRVVDLGQWWEETTGHPIPLGGIAARRDLGAELIRHIDESLRASVEFAHANPEQVQDYVALHAQEMDPEVMRAHIRLYVNDYTLGYGTDGEAAITDLMSRAVDAGIIPPPSDPLFVAGV
jgi:1,4-dihydroxy-6-naphthoate synthase